MKNRAYHPFTNRTAVLLSLMIGTILNAIMSLGYIYTKDIEPSAEIRTICIFITNIVLLYLLYKFCFKAVQLEVNKTIKLGLLLGGSFSITVLLSLVLSKFFFLLVADNRVVVDEYYTANLIKDLILSIIVLLSTFLLNSVSERQQTLLENEKLIAENMRIHYEVLKNQVDPHFLFNSLNTLDGLIGVADDKAHDFLQNISLVFRYVISNKEITNLEKELDFTESYASLMRIRYGDNLQIEYSIEDKYKKYFIMPISLQLLVENAIKHNVTSTKYPLRIFIETTLHDTIRVVNPIQLRQEVKSGTRIGLVNLTERYQLLFKKEISISKTDMFSVEIPLIKHI